MGLIEDLFFEPAPWFKGNDEAFEMVQKKASAESIAKTVDTLKEISTAIPILGPFLAILYDKLEAHPGEGDQDEDPGEIVRDVMDNVISQNMYNINPDQVQEARRYYNQIADALALSTKNLSRAQTKLAEIAAHVDDYATGVQKKAMKSAHDIAKKDNLALEDSIEDNTKKLNRADLIQQTMSDLSLTPVSAENEAKVKKIASQYGIDLSLNDTKVN